MKTEFEKMRSCELANTSDSSIAESINRAHEITARMNRCSGVEPEYRSLLRTLIPGIPDTATIVPPFYCDHGHGLHLGENVFVNNCCTFLDGADITIGDYTLIGPNVQIYTPQHPRNYLERRAPQEYAYPVKIGRDCWIGGGAIICPGVTIGDRCIVAAGSVVTHDVPDDSLVAGNPAKVKKKLQCQKLFE